MPYGRGKGGRIDVSAKLRRFQSSILNINAGNTAQGWPRPQSVYRRKWTNY